ncbi:hypothetical protein [Aquipuribacter hungaricus]|uniref:Secreted protein n=1 Tax=Aquipuribacter hungaricus TaxID=545624 RepID=A0ABV7WJX7_9MICO
MLKHRADVQRASARTWRAGCGLTVFALLLGGCSDTPSQPEATDGLDCDGLMRVSSHFDYAAGEAPEQSTPEDAARDAAGGTPVVEDRDDDSSSARVFMESSGRALTYVDVRRDASGAWTADSITKCAN